MMLYIEDKVDNNRTSCQSNKDNHNKAIAMLKSKQVHVKRARTDNVHNAHAHILGSFRN